MLEQFLYKSYFLFFDLSLWRNRHFTPAGAMVITAIILSGILGFNVFRTLIYQIMALGCSLAILSLVLSLFPFKIKIKVDRILPDFVTVDESMIYEIELVNLSKKTQKGLILYENLKDPRPSLKQLLTQKEPYETHRNAWDKKTLYYRWLWLIKKDKKVGLSPIKLPDLPVGESIRIQIKSTPCFRGYIHFSSFTFARSDTMGLFNRLYHIKKNQKLLVLPKRYQLQTPNLYSTRQYHPGGISLTSSIGNSNEFMSLRRYRPGDPLKNIHWRTFAKTNELVIKEFEDEYFVRHALILDTFLNSENENLFEQAVSIASSYIYSMQTHESILDLMFVGNHIYSFSTGRGLSHSEKMLEIMACVQPCADKSILDLIPILKANIKQFSGSICIFLGWTKAHQKIVQLFEQAMVPVFIIIMTEDDLKTKENILNATDTANGTKDINGMKIVQTDKIAQTLGQS
ncbi:MAG: DUF58 domain-containing protein [Pseudomonadota bacterium]